ncbi:amidohydrolase [Mycolicibacterium pulveris]|uniref:Amidohydrolase n=1 Tax=Mycolicibacterium pulveris TaxID=36813 RepID=A0A7I7UPK9_MYCPV|nr:amidohydrolase family protein [Mycolicibacterium pulveris]MCV6983535.1 amidohydrolase [Mycolicibacterium pulveris]BBY83414.1 amidohydrolase [Mycolicibacterium pulveris]
MPADWYPLISCDSHVHEPRALYRDRLPSRLLDRAPRVVSDPNGDKIMMGDKLVRFIGLEAMEEYDTADRTYKGARFEVGRKGKFEAEARMHDLAVDGVEGEVVYGFSYWMDQNDREVLLEMIYAYNDWVHEFIEPTKDRSIAPAMLPTWDIDLAIAEAQRAVGDLGARAVQIAAPYVGELKYGYREADFDRLWSAIVELGVPVTMHIGSGKPKGRFRGPGAVLCDFMATFNDSPNLLVEFIGAGVFLRHPELKLAVTEGGIGWAPWLVMMMDRMWDDNGSMLDFKLPEPPSYYFKNNCLATWQEDMPGINSIDMIAEAVAWGSDYPHREGTFPHSRQKVEQQVANLDPVLVRRLTSGNAAKFFGFDVDLIVERYGPDSEHHRKYAAKDGGSTTPDMVAPITAA